MGKLKEPQTTSLDTAGLVDQWHLDKLRALGVTTVEELFGLIQSDPSATSRFLEVSNLAILQSDAVGQIESQLLAAMEDQQEPTFGLGAEPPDKVEVETEASLETFNRYLAETGSISGDGGDGVDLRACFGPVRDQGRRGTCVAHAVVAMMECLIGRAAGELDLAEQWLYWRCKEVDGNQRSGTLIEIGTEEAVSTGVCLEDVWPYNPLVIDGNEGHDPPPDGAAAAADQRMDAWEELAYRSTTAIQEALDGDSPVAIGVPVYDNWYSNPAANALGNIPMPLPFSLLKGGHAMCIVGYDFDPDVPGGAGFIVRNSWGTGWAPRSAIAPGYGVLPFPYVEQYGWGAFVFKDA
jgi:papain like protease